MIFGHGVRPTQGHGNIPEDPCCFIAGYHFTNVRLKYLATLTLVYCLPTNPRCWGKASAGIVRHTRNFHIRKQRLRIRKSLKISSPRPVIVSKVRRFTVCLGDFYRVVSSYLFKMKTVSLPPQLRKQSRKRSRSFNSPLRSYTHIFRRWLLLGPQTRKCSSFSRDSFFSGTTKTHIRYKK